MKHAVLLLLLLAVAACAGTGPRGPYVGGAVGGSLHEDSRLR